MVRPLAWLAGVTTILALATALPAVAAEVATPSAAGAPSVIGEGTGGHGADGSAPDASGTWISLIPATSSAISQASSPSSSVWISLIPATSMAVGESDRTTAAVVRTAESAVSSTESAARTAESAAPGRATEGSVSSARPGALRRGPGSGAVAMAGASASPAAPVGTGSATRWVAVGAGVVLVLLGASVLVLRTRRLGRR